MDISKIIDFFYNVTRLDTLVMDRSNQVVEKMRTLTCPNVLRQQFLECEQHLLELAGSLQPGQHRQEFVPVFHVYYLLLRVSEELHLLVGPYAYDDVPADTVSQVMRTYSIPNSLHNECSRFYLTLPKNFRSAPLTSSLLLSLFQNGFSESTPVSPVDKPPARRLPRRKYGALQAIRNVSYQYAEEDRIRAAVRNGNTEAALRYLSLGVHRFEYRSDSVSLWHIQHMLSVLGTIMRLAAREGGAAPQAVHEISEQYFFLIPSCKGSGDAGLLLSQMAAEYCHAVRASWSEAYSPITRSALSYLHEHFREHVSIQNIADSIPCHPTYLCGRFKQETHATLIQTLTDIRLDHALMLLSDPTRSVAQIYRESGFESYQRFSSAFKRKFGCSCSQWRKASRKPSLSQNDQNEAGAVIIE